MSMKIGWRALVPSDENEVVALCDGVYSGNDYVPRIFRSDWMCRQADDLLWTLAACDADSGAIVAFQALRFGLPFDGAATLEGLRVAVSG